VLGLSKADALNLGKALDRAGGLDDYGYLNDLVLTVTNVASIRSLDLTEIIALYDADGGKGANEIAEILHWDRKISNSIDVERYLPVVEDFVAYLIEERGTDRAKADPKRQREAVNLISSILGEMGAGIEPKDLLVRLEKVALYDGEGNFTALIALLEEVHQGGDFLASEASINRAFALLGDSPLASLLIQSVL
jgi:hypothetical protein